ncbi:MAG: hypothetical protein JWO45_893 [Spartobacteria bacterium]|nr:hypothetical protein [Spartobacteria bacterium]
MNGHIEDCDQTVADFAELFIGSSPEPTPWEELLRHDLLDFSVGSLDHVNAYLESVRQQPGAEDVWNRICLRAGAYLGEVIRRNGLLQDWHWLDFENARKIDPTSFDQFGHAISTAFVLHQGGESFCFPLGKICKYLENGSEDNTHLFAQATITRWLETQHEYA